MSARSGLVEYDDAGRGRDGPRDLHELLLRLAEPVNLRMDINTIVDVVQGGLGSAAAGLPVDNACGAAVGAQHDVLA